MVVHNQEEIGEGSAMPIDPQHTPTITQPSTSQPQKTQKPRKPKRKNTKVPQPSGSTEHVADKVVNEEMDDSLVRVTTTASSLEAEQDSGSGPRHQDTMGDTIAQTRFENVSKTSNDSLLVGVNTPRRDEEITLVDETQGRYGDDLRFDKCVLDDEEVFAGQDMAEKEINVDEKEVSTADPVTTAGEVVTTASVEISTAKPTETTITNDLTLAQTLIEIRSKAIIEEPEKPTKRKDQIRHDEEVAQRLQAQLQAELEEEDRLVEGSEVRAEGSDTIEEGSSKRAGDELE
ncbi:hypothetical protein Tco_0548019 [Tanacetum coccineum]